MIITRYPPGEHAQGYREHTCQDDVETHLLSRTVSAPKAMAGAWSPITLRNDYRNKENIESCSAVGVDIDGGATLDAAIEAFAAFAGYIHSTASSKPQALRLRVILWLASPMTSVADHELVTVAMQRRAPGKVDRGAKDASRLWYLPTSHADHFVHAGLVGDPLDGHAIAAAERARLEAEQAERRARRFAPMPPTDGSYAARALTKACRAIEQATEGERHDTLTREAWNLGTLVGAGLISRDVVISALDAASARVFPEKRERERVRTLEGQVDLGMQTPREVRRSPWGS